MKEKKLSDWIMLEVLAIIFSLNKGGRASVDEMKEELV